MTITAELFKNEGREQTKRRPLQKNILLLLRANPDKAISSKEFENGFNVRRQSVHQALRALEEKGLIERGLIQEGKRHVVYATITEKGKTTKNFGANDEVKHN